MKRKNEVVKIESTLATIKYAIILLSIALARRCEDGRRETGEESGRGTVSCGKANKRADD